MFFLIGVSLVLYPWVDRYLQKQQQLRLLTEWEQVHLENNLSFTPNLSKLEQARIAELETGEEPWPEVDDEEEAFIIPPEQSVIGKINIDKIDVEEAIVQGASEQSLNLGIGTVLPDRRPGRKGNFALAGHRGWSYGYQFNRLDELEDGDLITITTAEQRYTYQVTDKFIVPPDDLSVLEQSDDTAEITLITCEPMFRSTHRLIVKAEWQNEKAEKQNE